MNELQKELLDILKTSKGFVAEQGPEYLQQFFQKEALEAKVWAVICLLILLLSIFGFIRGLFIDDEYSIEKPLSLIFGGIFSLLSIVSIFCNLTNAYSIVHFPKAYLVDKLTSNKRCSK